MSRSRDFNGLSLEQSVLLAQTTDSMAVLDELLDHPHLWVRRAIVRNSHVSLRGQHWLSKDPDHEIRVRLAGSPHTSQAVLKDMAKDTDWRIRAAVAKSPRSPVSALIALAGDHTVEVRRAVARNRQTPASVLAEFYGAEDSVLIRILERRRSQMLYEQAKGEILSQIERACEAAEEACVQGLVTVMEKHGASYFVHLFRSSEISPEVAHRLAAHDDAEARQLIAGYPKLDPATMASLAIDGDVGVRRELASNPSIDARSIGILFRDPAKEVRQRLSANDAIPYDVRCGFIGGLRGPPVARHPASNEPISAEVQILVAMAALAASWLIYFAVRWL